MDWISVLDHKHLPSAHSGAPCQHSALSRLPGTSRDESLIPDTESNVKNTCCGSSCWKNKFFIVFFWNPFGNLTLPPMWRHIKWAQCGVGTALELMVLISRAQTETSVFELSVFICYRPFSSAFKEKAVTVYIGDSMVTFFPPSTCSLWRARLGLRFCSCQIPFLIS